MASADLRSAPRSARRARDGHRCRPRAARQRRGAGLLGTASSAATFVLRSAIPQALEQILPGAAGDVDITGIGQFGRPWTLSIARIAGGSAAGAADRPLGDHRGRENARRFCRQRQPRIAHAAIDHPRLFRNARRRGRIWNTAAPKFGSIIRGEAQRMLRIIEDLMSLSRIEAGRFVDPGRPGPIGEVVDERGRQCRRIAGDDQCNIEPRCRDRPSADPRRPRPADCNCSTIC